MLDAGCWILDTGYWILDTGYLIPDYVPCALRLEPYAFVRYWLKIPLSGIKRLFLIPQSLIPLSAGHNSGLSGLRLYFSTLSKMEEKSRGRLPNEKDCLQLLEMLVSLHKNVKVVYNFFLYVFVCVCLCGSVANFVLKENKY